ncbi:MAG TPA: ATP-dependent DNA ligase [Propionibacteriaceae bacterium]|nr:ATP-dependent DNA ligase [Propionibacteriaceae bacterium]
MTASGAFESPVAVELAVLAESIPPERRLPGGCVYEPKWDGYRLVILRAGDRVALWSRNGTELTGRFPEIAAAAAEQLRCDAVIDGEVVVWDAGRLSFDYLQKRLGGNASALRDLVRRHPASYVGFDLLACREADLRPQPWTLRRQTLEELAAGWRPPLQLSPYTRDVAEARQWFEDYRPAGVEGLVVKGAASSYRPGRRGWIKIKSRETLEVLVGAVIGPIDRPESFIAGLYTTSGDLVPVGRSAALSSGQSGQLGRILTPAGDTHPWPETMGAGRFGGARDKIVLTRVDPVLVAEVTADTALQGGRFRHPLRFVRHRLDVQPEDLAPIPPG